MSNRIELDKYYTNETLAKYCVEKTIEIIGKENISEFLEPSAGEGVFLKYFNKPYLAYDIEPEGKNIVKQDYLNLQLENKEGRCIIGNPPFGSRMNLAQKFFKKSIQLGDYIAFILPISQLHNSSSLYEFDLIYSEDLGRKFFTDRKLHCCFNIYKRPSNNQLNTKPIKKLKDVTIIRQDSRKYNEIKDYDLRICYWGHSAGKVLSNDENYSAEYKIIVNNKSIKDRVISVLDGFNWHKEIKFITMPKIQQFHIVNVLKKHISEIE